MRLEFEFTRVNFGRACGGNEGKFGAAQLRIVNKAELIAGVKAPPLIDWNGDPRFDLADKSRIGLFKESRGNATSGDRCGGRGGTARVVALKLSAKTSP